MGSWQPKATPAGFLFAAWIDGSGPATGNVHGSLAGWCVPRGESGPLHGRSVQPRRIAILALLACDSRHTLSRDKLIGYLWREGGRPMKGRPLLFHVGVDLRIARYPPISGNGKSELKISRATFQLPSACRFQISMYFPWSSTGSSPSAAAMIMV